MGSSLSSRETDTEMSHEGMWESELDEGCNKPGDGVPKPVWKGGVGGGKWENFTKEGAFGVILKKEQE